MQQQNQRELSMEEESSNYNCYIPTEVLVEIFCRLPSKTLVRFTSISKSVRAIITHPTFTSKHLKHCSVTTNRCGYIIIQHHDRVVERLSSNLSITHQNLQHQLQYYAGLSLQAGSYRIAGCCDGLLLCVRISDNPLYLWNPSTGKVKKLPTVKREPYYVSQLCGFGFDSTSNDHKVVQIFEHMGFSDNGVGGCKYRCQVYSLKAEEWRWIELKLFYHDTLYHHDFQLQGVGTSCNDGFYFLSLTRVEGEDAKRLMVMNFSFRNETFQIISLPDDGHVISIGTFKQSLALITQRGLTFDAWVLKQEEVGIRSWNKLNTFSFGPKGTVLMMVRPNGDGQALLREWNGDEECYVELQKLDFWEKHEPVALGLVHGFYSYSESLLLS